jgi:hypothetical protein
LIDVKLWVRSGGLVKQGLQEEHQHERIDLIRDRATFNARNHKSESESCKNKEAVEEVPYIQLYITEQGINVHRVKKETLPK